MAKKKKPKKLKKQKRKLTSAERAAKRFRREHYRIIFINGKQKRVPREPEIEPFPWAEDVPTIDALARLGVDEEPEPTNAERGLPF